MTLKPEWDEETLSIIRGYCGRDPRVPRKVERRVFLECEGTWLLDGFSWMINNAVARLSDEDRASALIELDGLRSSGLIIRYTSEETPEEVAETELSG